ncbi:MAG: DUF1743 domain-containing protein [Thaumarchaeota archaeon]|nr:DUF1743 domain-containing protein [Nitrososphaerota archaeon]
MHVAHIGIDDTDSERGMCTTYLATLIVERLIIQGASFVDYPNLIRLNPNIPWKTRGNAAVALRLHTANPYQTFNIAKRLLIENSEAKKGLADPGLIMHVGTIPKDIAEFSRRALHDVVSKHEAENIIKRYNMQHYAEGSGRGLIGAVAAIGNTLPQDHTFEIIAYRDKSYSNVRKVDKDSIIRMDRDFSTYTFNNYDESTDRILICPHGPDPVLCGIRGENPAELAKALSVLKFEEPIDRYMIFRSNQGTGEHLAEPLQEFRAHVSGFVRGHVTDRAKTQQGGHVFFYIQNSVRKIKCACYEPAGELRKVALSLIKGDEIEVGGGVRKASKLNPAVLNIEYLKIIKLVQNKVLENPLCSNCNRRMKSEGRGKGFSCQSCTTFTKRKTAKIIPRNIKEGLYLPPLHSQRHLTRPLKRINIKNSSSRMIENWFRIFEEQIARIW